MVSYRLVSSDREFPLAQGENLVGHFSHCEVQVDGEGVAGEHARLDVTAETLKVTDLGSKGGTLLDGVAVTGTAPVRAGQTLGVGSVTLRVACAAAEPRWSRSEGVRRLLRIALRLTAAVATAAVLAFLVLRLVYDAESMRQDIVRSIEALLSRDADIGSVELDALGGRIRLKDLVVHNLPEFGGEPLITAPSVDVRFGTGRYLSALGYGVRAEVSVRRPVVLLERSERGRWNVSDFAEPLVRALWECEGGLRWKAPWSDLDLHVRVTDATVRLRDDLEGHNEEIGGVVLELSLSALSKPLEYRLAMEVPVAGRSGRIEMTGTFRLFAGGMLTDDSVRGEVVRLTVDGLDVRALPALPAAVQALLTAPSGPSMIDLDLVLSAETLRSVKLQVSGRLRGGGPIASAVPGRPGRGNAAGGEAGEVTFEAALEGNLAARSVDRAEMNVRAPAWEVDGQGRLVPAEAGAEILDLDASLRMDLAVLSALRGFLPARLGAPLAGDLIVKISTTGPTRKLGVRADVRAEGLACPATGAAPEDASVAFRGDVGLVGWRGIDSVRVQTFTAEASFLNAAAAPGEISGLADPRRAAARLGPIEMEMDLAELVRRYGPLLPAQPPPARVHCWAELAGGDGRLAGRFEAETRDGPRADGTIGVRFDDADGPVVQFASRLVDRDGPEKLDGALGGELRLAGPEPKLDVTVAATGALSRALDLARPYLGPVGSVWARGRFDLHDARLSGTPGRFTTTGRLTLLEPELWGGLPMAEPFADSRFDAIWNLEADLSQGPARLKAELLRGSSSTLQFMLTGEAEDLRAGLGSCDLTVFADFNRLGSLLKKLGLVPQQADFRGRMDVELHADTRLGDISLERFEIVTPLLEATGGGQISHLPLAGLLGRAAAPGTAQAGAPGRADAETLAGNIHMSANLDAGAVSRFVRVMAAAKYGRIGHGPDAGGSGGPPPEAWAEAGGEMSLEVSAQGSGGQLVVAGRLDLDRFVGRLGRYLRKTADELASLEFAVSVVSAGPDLATLRSGVLTLGGAENPARLLLAGRLARALDTFELSVRSERFPVAPLAALAPGLGRPCSGEAGLSLTARGRLIGARLLPGALTLDGRVAFHRTGLTWRRLPLLHTVLDGEVVLGGKSATARGFSVAFSSGVPASPSPDVAATDDRADGAASFSPAGEVTLESLDLRAESLPPGVEGSFAASARGLDLAALALALEGNAGGAPAEESRTCALPTGVDVSGLVSVDRAVLWDEKVALEGLTARLEAGRDGVRLADLGFSLWGGRFDGTASFDFSGGRLGTRGEIASADVDLGRVAASSNVPGALAGTAGGTIRWEGYGFDRAAIERTWEIDIASNTREVSLSMEKWPLAAVVGAEVARVLGRPAPPGPTVKSNPASLGIAFRRGRLTMEATKIEFEDGLRLGMRGSAEMDGRIRGWLTMEQLPTAGVAIERHKALDALARRGVLQFAVGGTWARPTADARVLTRLLDTPWEWMGHDASEDAEPDTGDEAPAPPVDAP